MSQIVAGFRHSALTYEPYQLSNREIWTVAHNVRSQLQGDALQRRLDLSSVEEKAARFEVNGIRYGVLWDLDHEVRNAEDREVMGVTEYHEATPLHVLVSINGPRLKEPMSWATWCSMRRAGWRCGGRPSSNWHRRSPRGPP